MNENQYYLFPSKKYKCEHNNASNDCSFELEQRLSKCLLLSPFFLFSRFFACLADTSESKTVKTPIITRSTRNGKKDNAAKMSTGTANVETCINENKFQLKKKNANIISATVEKRHTVNTNRWCAHTYFFIAFC